MIPCINELQLNKYKAVNIPNNADLFARYGERVSVPSSPDGSNAVFNSSKLDGYEEAQKVVDKFLFEEQEAYEASQAEIERLRLESDELKTLKENKE